MIMSKVLILKKTKNGRRAEPILKKEAIKLVENGEAIKMPDGIYKYMDKVGKVEVKKEEKPKTKKKTYKTKILKAED